MCVHVLPENSVSSNTGDLTAHTKKKSQNAVAGTYEDIIQDSSFSLNLPSILALQMRMGPTTLNITHKSPHGPDTESTPCDLSYMHLELIVEFTLKEIKLYLLTNQPFDKNHYRDDYSS